MDVFSDVLCALGEGPLWHPKRKQLFWFDILGKRLFSKGANNAGGGWQFDEYVSAAGWIDHDTLLMASETGLWRYTIGTVERELVVPLEADNPATRSNDGRADPQGGFWIGTMGINAEPGAGAIYRYHRGTLRQLFDGITISNAICFAPDGRTAYFTDTATQIIQRVALDDDGWPAEAPQVFIDLRDDDLNPDGAVVDATGNLWNAQWGAGQVACYSPDGRLLRRLPVPASQPTCPAFAGTTLYVTTAAKGCTAPEAGFTFAAEVGVVGQAEHQVIL
ncbi:SMP-30/gluconolactonase/LRE family protein [Tateyamaria sp. SN6-1]|uniref:SMP-30/gluconolactonase/LRE family protein n=1 Tax=Tateyamaria sp. SN6-1 TaxID=3092148 RepID=UPI0039F5F28F